MSKILIVDDEADVALLLAEFLQKQGYELIIRNTIKGAIEDLKGSEKFDLVITDLIMPEQDGFDILNYINDNDLNIPTLLISGGGRTLDIENIKEAMSGLATEVMTKPVDFDVFVETVKRLTSIQAAQQSGVAQMKHV